MEQTQDPILKQCITSMAFGSNLLKQNTDGICVFKNDNQTPKTVSLLLARIPQVANSYVHVLKCSICDFLTLNTDNLKEHFKIRHPTSSGFWTYSCFSCSSMSTEKSLMEEHLRMYHRVTDSPTGKLVERFHESGVHDGISITTTSTSIYSSSVNHCNASNANNQPHTDACQSKTSVHNDFEETGTTLPSVPTSNTQLEALLHKEKKEDSHSVKLDEPTFTEMSESIGVRSVTPASLFSGSRRRKSTNPGRICPRTSVSDYLTSEEQLKNKSDESGVDTSLSDSDHSALGQRSIDIEEDLCVEPKAKKPCTTDLTAHTMTSPTKQPQHTASSFPMLLSLGSTVQDAVNRGQNPGLGTFGQLIPISGLPEQLLCGITTSLPGTNNTTSNCNTATSSAMTFTLPLLNANQSTAATGQTSAWLLTSHANNLVNSTQTGQTAFHPTFLVPMGNTMSESVTSKTQTSQLMEQSGGIENRNHTPYNMVRIADLIELLRNASSTGSAPTTIDDLPTAKVAAAAACKPKQTENQNSSSSTSTTAAVNLPNLISSLSNNSGTTASALLNQLVLAAMVGSTNDGGNKVPQINGTSHDQALDMSVRSDLGPAAQQPFCLNSTPNSVTDVAAKQAVSNAYAIQGVVEALNSALGKEVIKQYTPNALNANLIQYLNPSAALTLNQNCAESTTRSMTDISSDDTPTLQSPPVATTATTTIVSSTTAEPSSVLISSSGLDSGYAGSSTTSTESKSSIQTPTTPLSQFVNLPQLQALMAAVAMPNQSVSLNPPPGVGSTPGIPIAGISSQPTSLATVPLAALQNNHLTQATQFFLTPSGLTAAHLPGQDSGTALVLPNTDTSGSTVLLGRSSTPANATGPMSPNMGSAGLKINTSVSSAEGIPPNSTVLATINNPQMGQLNSALGNPTLINLVATSSRPMTGTQTSITLKSTAAARLLTSLTNFPSTTNTMLHGLATTHANGTQPGMINLFDPSAVLGSASTAVSGTQIALTTNAARTAMNGNAIAKSLGITNPLVGVHLRFPDSNTTTVPVNVSTGLFSQADITHAFNGHVVRSAGLNNNSITGLKGDLSADGRRKGLETDGEYPSSTDSHHEDDWEAMGGDGTQSANQLLRPAGIKTESGSASSSPSLLTSSVHRRVAPAANRHSRKNHSPDSPQAGRPHRQNFTPTQNRILTEWYQIHQAKPYPSTDDTKELANISGLSYSQVKKWFANKRARSSSSGLPKPTPPLAPDSSSDPSTAAAMVAAAMAAASSGSITIDSIPNNQPYLFPTNHTFNIPVTSHEINLTVGDISTSLAATLANVSVASGASCPPVSSEANPSETTENQTEPTKFDSQIQEGATDTAPVSISPDCAESPPTLEVVISPRSFSNDTREGLRESTEVEAELGNTADVSTE